MDAATVDAELELVIGGGDEPLQLEKPKAAGGLSPQLEQLRLAGISQEEMHKAFAEEEAAMQFVDEPLSLPADAVRRDAEAAALPDAAEDVRPSSCPNASEDGPRTWPNAASQPASGVSTPTALGSPERNLFGAEGGALPWIDDGQIAEEDSLAFRENLNRLSLECVDKVDACEKFAGVTRGCAEAVAALASAEQLFAQNQPPAGGDEAEPAAASAAASEALSTLMGESSAIRQDLAAKMRALVAEPDGLPSAAEEEEAQLAARTVSGKGKRSVWREVAKVAKKEKKHALLRELDELAVQVDKAKTDYEEALSLKLDFSLDPTATEASEESTNCRRRKKALDGLRIRYVRGLERLAAEKEAELLDRSADVFFAQRDVRTPKTHTFRSDCDGLRVLTLLRRMGAGGGCAARCDGQGRAAVRDGPHRRGRGAGGRGGGGRAPRADERSRRGQTRQTHTTKERTGGRRSAGARGGGGGRGGRGGGRWCGDQAAAEVGDGGCAERA